jgi:hypothetical protein
VSIASTVTTIGREAFADCIGLSNVTIPVSVTNIGMQAFAGCTSLTAIDVVSSNLAYSSASGVLFNKNQTVLIACPARKAGNYAVPVGITAIGNGAFTDCASLTSVAIPSTVTTIGRGAFAGCTNLTAIDVVSSNLAYSSASGVLFNKSRTVLIACPARKAGNYAVSVGVTVVGDMAFSGCDRLTNLAISASVTTIGGGAFAGCASLTAIDVVSSNLAYSSASGVLFNKRQTVLIACPARKAGSYTVPSGVTTIGGGAFADCANLTSVAIPATVANVGNSAFMGCANLTNVTIPNSVTNIECYAFHDCANLTKVTIPSNVTTISDGAFGNCSSLTSVIIPKSVTTIGDGTFAFCSSLIDVSIPNSVTNIGRNAFVGCANLPSLITRSQGGGYEGRRGALGGEESNLRREK